MTLITGHGESLPKRNGGGRGRVNKSNRLLTEIKSFLLAGFGDGYPSPNIRLYYLSGHFLMP